MSEYGMQRDEAILGIPLLTGVSMIHIANGRNTEQQQYDSGLTGVETLHDLRMSQYNV